MSTLLRSFTLVIYIIITTTNHVLQRRYYLSYYQIRKLRLVRSKPIHILRHHVCKCQSPNISSTNDNYPKHGASSLNLCSTNWDLRKVSRIWIFLLPLLSTFSFPPIILFPLSALTQGEKKAIVTNKKMTMLRHQ